MLWAPGVVPRCWAVDLAEKVWKGEDVHTLERCQLITRGLKHPSPLSDVDSAHMWEVLPFHSLGLGLGNIHSSIPLGGCSSPFPGHVLPWLLTHACEQQVWLWWQHGLPFPGSWIMLPCGMRDSDVPRLLNALYCSPEVTSIPPPASSHLPGNRGNEWAEMSRGAVPNLHFRQGQIKDNNALLRLEIAGRQKNNVAFPDYQRHCSLPAHPAHGFFDSFLPLTLKLIYNLFQELTFAEMFLTFYS